MSKKKRKLQRIRVRKMQIRQQKSPRNLLKQVEMTVNHYLKDLPKHIDTSYKDPRRKGSITYTLSEIILAGVYMYMMRCTSRNDLNEERQTNNFKKNYRRIFRLKFPHMDTVNDVFVKLDEQIIEKIKRYIIRLLFSRRVLHKYKLANKYIKIAIDGTGIFTYDKEPYPGCSYKISKTGKKTYYQNVVEAKIVAENGFSISICSEWIINEDGKTKQDCEYNATLRLMDKLKKDYPRLPICLLLDGLFSKVPIKEKILKNKWQFIIVWKAKTLYKLQDMVAEHRKENKISRKQKEIYHNSTSKTIMNYEYDTYELNNRGVPLYHISLEEHHKNITQKEKDTELFFMFMSSIKPINLNIEELIKAGRLRWKIENEGFNVQKRIGYNLHHKMNRTNLTAIKNYYNCLQIAHIINQLITLCTNSITNLWHTVIKVWNHFKAALLMIEDFEPITNHKRYNFRY